MKNHEMSRKCDIWELPSLLVTLKAYSIAQFQNLMKWLKVFIGMKQFQVPFDAKGGNEHING
jgi:hypothetical protein